ncbi:MAG: hypothetical protein HUU55_17190 [Myxococcales bacterium]|nr:hypothetical protein [Myxococcales bacterium]
MVWKIGIKSIIVVGMGILGATLWMYACGGSSTSYPVDTATGDSPSAQESGAEIGSNVDLLPQDEVVAMDVGVDDRGFSGDSGETDDGATADTVTPDGSGGGDDGYGDGITDGDEDGDEDGDGVEDDGGAVDDGGSAPDIVNDTDGPDGGGCAMPCDDGNVCNGEETCDPKTGCVPGSPLSCDDGNVCNGKETCDPKAGCQSTVFPACPQAPPECNQMGGSGGPTKGKLTMTEAGGFRLFDENTWAAKGTILDELAAQPSIKPVSLDTVLANLNRTATKVSSVSGVECFHTGFTWNSGDNRVAYWYPQGITGTADAYAAGSYKEHKVVVVSWYHKPDVEGTASNKGVRLAITDVTDMANIQYRLVLLVEPYMNGTTPDFKPIPVHAGGIAWVGDWLYVADTANGFRVFDMGRILEVHTGNNEWIGKVSATEGYHAFNYRYVVPQVGRYKLCSGSCCTRFSYVALDRSTTPISLVSGEYSADSIAGRVVRWPLDPQTGLLKQVDGRVQAAEAAFPGIDNMQGALSWKDQYFLSCSGNVLGLYIAKPTQTLAKRTWPYGPEDLHYAPSSDNLWSLTEHPDQRFVFAVKLSAVAAGCK